MVRCRQKTLDTRLLDYTGCMRDHKKKRRVQGCNTALFQLTMTMRSKEQKEHYTISK